METFVQPGICPCHGRPQVDLLLRKSKIVREGERALSIQTQEDMGRGWAAESDHCVRKVWKENLSAWSDVKRPKMDAAIDAVLAGEVRALWCYALDRFSRKGAESVVPILGKARVIFDYERLDSMDERDRRWIIDRAENAREYSQRLSYNVRATKAKQQKQGKWLGTAPFGLTADANRRLSPDTTPYMCLLDERREVTPWEVVKRIFWHIGNGMAARALAKKLNAEGLRTSRGALWQGGTIWAIVVHPVYEGWLTVAPAVGNQKSHKRATRYVHPDTGQNVRCVTDETLPHMIPAELAERARRVLAGHQFMAKENFPRAGRVVHPISGKSVKCHDCGYSMSLHGTSYVCNLSKTGTGACTAPASVRKDPLIRYLVDAWSARLHAAEDDDPLLVAVAERWQAITRPEEGAEVAEARAEVKAAQAELDRFHQDDAAGFYTGRSARYRIPTKNRAEARLDAAEERLAGLVGKGSINITWMLEGQAAQVWHNVDLQTQRDLLSAAIDRIIVKPGKRGQRFNGAERVTIVWATPEQVEHDAEEFAQAA
ncbi:recombinase family protein [Kitasatospora cineracea]|uniref:Resolvase-like protein n=1 Tax=Kitasatospora cineracea TaxID=88074 RepID=A0A3N4RKC4_9ACTN|nr:recombinase family protein [Kitasatospora cineracea]RPE33226.1 resolvase-like protein [Kitasatospora cineracea]